MRGQRRVTGRKISEIYRIVEANPPDSSQLGKLVSGTLAGAPLSSSRWTIWRSQIVGNFFACIGQRTVSLPDSVAIDRFPALHGNAMTKLGLIEPKQTQRVQTADLLAIALR